MRDRQNLNIIVPVYNEQRSLTKLYHAVADALEDVAIAWQLTFIDDGSTDNSLASLHRLAKKYDNVVVIALSRNFGKELALTAGLHANTHDSIIMMDSDLQHPPRYLPEFIEQWRAGSQVVVGVRSSEGKDSRIKTITAPLFYYIINKVSEVHIVPKATDFRLLDKEVVDAFNAMPEHNRITRGMIDWLGFDRSYLYFDADERDAGEASYTMRKLIKLAADSFLSMTLLPLRVSFYLGFFITLAFGVLGLFIAVSKYILNDRYDFSGPAALATVIAFLIGIVLMNIGFLGLYIAKIHEQTKGRPLYVINNQTSSGK